MTDLAPAARPDLSVIIVNRNTRELLDECLASIAELPNVEGREVIVVDNGSTDGSMELVRQSYPNTRLIRNELNTGYALANNQGLAISTGRYLLLLNSDTVVQAHALALLVEFMDSHPAAGACGPLLRYPDGRLQRSCYSDPSPRSNIARMLGLDVLFPKTRLFGNQYYGFDHAHTAPVDAMLGAALLVRREAMERVGVLDEELRLHFNDFDWCLRIRKAGWRVYFVHEAEIVHHLQATTRVESQTSDLQREIVRNFFYYIRKHRGRGGLILVRVGLVIGFFGRYALFRLLDVLELRQDSQQARRFRIGMFMAGLRGRPGEFGISGQE
jgi:GT2 family glycosyltransferase